jgi:hypothetical protein
MGVFDESIFATRVQRIAAPQAHPIPSHAHMPSGPFPPELTQGDPASEPKMVIEYNPAFPEDGSDMPIGGTAQNKFKADRWLRCVDCFERVKEAETDLHTCEVSDDE